MKQTTKKGILKIYLSFGCTNAKMVAGSFISVQFNLLRIYRIIIIYKGICFDVIGYWSGGFWSLLSFLCKWHWCW